VGGGLGLGFTFTQKLTLNVDNNYQSEILI